MGGQYITFPEPDCSLARTILIMEQITVNKTIGPEEKRRKFKMSKVAENSNIIYC